MANAKEKGCSNSFIIGMGFIIFFATIAWVSSCSHTIKESKLPVIPITFDGIEDLSSKVYQDPDQRVSITGLLSNLDNCTDPTAKECNAGLVAENPKSTDTRVFLTIPMTTEKKHTTNSVFLNASGDHILVTTDKQQLPSDRLITVTGHISVVFDDLGKAISYADIEVDIIESAP